jgi:hypothetical protein
MVTFVKDASGKVIELVIRQNTRESKIPRLG